MKKVAVILAFSVLTILLYQKNLFGIKDYVQYRITNYEVHDFPLLVAQNELDWSILNYGKRASKTKSFIEKIEKVFERQYKKYYSIDSLNRRPIHALNISRKIDQKADEIAIEIETLENEFENVKLISSKYFEETDIILIELKDRPDSNEFINDVQTKKDEYNIVFLEASNAIKEMNRVYKDIDDFDRIIELYSSLGKIDNQIDKLKLITAKAKEITIKLHEFSKKSQKIIKI